MDLALAIARLAEHGLDAVGIAAGDGWDRVFPGCRSVLVVGNGGRTLWERFVADVARDPRLLVGEAHPLDRYVARILADVDPEPGPGRRWVRCAADDGADVDFRTLAVEAGLGWGSPLGLVLHPRFGPWMGLRAACFTTERWTPTLLGASPCASCARPCVSACPAGAVGTRFDIARCASAHAVPGPCAVTCHSRQACPVGTEHQYSDLQMHYHSDRRTGRVRLAAALAVTDDVHPGLGPFWDRAVQPSTSGGARGSKAVSRP